MALFSPKIRRAIARLLLVYILSAFMFFTPHGVEYVRALGLFIAAAATMCFILFVWLEKSEL